MPAPSGIPNASEMDPWYTRAEYRGMVHPEGLIAGMAGGRTDVHNINVPSGSYIMPADVVSGLAEGNTLAGASVMDRMMHSNPYGIEGGGGRHGAGPPHVRAPAPFHEPQARGGQVKKYDSGGRADNPPRPKEKPMYLDPRSLASPNVQQLAGVIPTNVASTLKYSQKIPVQNEDNSSSGGQPLYGGYKKGGDVHKQHIVPIVVAGGEILLHPHTIARKFGSLKKGHAVLDALVKRVRAENVKTLRKLPPPKT